MEIPARVPGATGNGATRPDMRNPSMIGLEAIHHEFKPLVALPHTNSPHKPVLNSPVWISSSRAIPLPRRQLPGACNLTLLQAQAQLRGLSRRSAQPSMPHDTSDRGLRRVLGVAPCRSTRATTARPPQPKGAVKL